MENFEDSLFIDPLILPILCGVNDYNIRTIEEKLGISLFIQNDKILITGEVDNIVKTKKILYNLIDIAKNKKNIKHEEVNLLIEQAKDNAILDSKEKNSNSLLIKKIGAKIEPKTENQIKYFNALRTKDLIISYGPAGTGKTYLAVGYAISELLSGRFKKLILTRPVVEAGEKLGFLPGDFLQKINPYLKPLYDAIFDIAGLKTYEFLKSKEILEIIPLAYMRGRTLNNAIIILDEAQNATISQIKMFLTRFGFQSKVIITGDITQVDLPVKYNSGLKVVIDILNNISEIAMIKFTKKDVVRHPLIKKIIKAFEKYESNNK